MTRSDHLSSSKAALYTDPGCHFGPLPNTIQVLCARLGSAWLFMRLAGYR